MPPWDYSSPITSLRVAPAPGIAAPESLRFSLSHLPISLLLPSAAKLARSYLQPTPSMPRPHSPEFQPAAPNKARSSPTGVRGSASMPSLIGLRRRCVSTAPRPTLARTRSSPLRKENGVSDGASLSACCQQNRVKSFDGTAELEGMKQRHRVIEIALRCLVTRCGEVDFSQLLAIPIRMWRCRSMCTSEPPAGKPRRVCSRAKPLRQPRFRPSARKFSRGFIR